MAVVWNGVALERQLREEAAKGLLRAAVHLQTQEKLRVNTSNQHGQVPSQPGEYPHKGTGFGQAGIVYEPVSVADVAREQRVRIGYLSNAFYMAILGVFRGRKWLADTAQELKAQLAQLTGRK